MTNESQMNKELVLSFYPAPNSARLDRILSPVASADVVVTRTRGSAMYTRCPHRCESAVKLGEPLRLSKTKPARADCDYLHSSGLMLGQLSSSSAEVAGQVMRICYALGLWEVLD